MRIGCASLRRDRCSGHRAGLPLRTSAATRAQLHCRTEDVVHPLPRRRTFDEPAGEGQHFGVDVHSQVGLSCHDCHGGNPDPKLGDDIGGAMDPKYKPNPYVGAPKRQDIPDFCGRCHSVRRRS